MSSITYGGNFLDKMISVLVLQIVLLILNAIFSSAEISVISLNEAKVKQMAEEGDKRAEKAAMLLKKPARFLETIESAVTFASLLSGAFVAVYIGGFLKAGCMHLLAKWNISVSGQVMSVAAIVAAALLLTYINLLFGEILPKRIAMSRTEEDSFKMVGILFFFAKIFAPLAVLLSVSSSLLLRIIGINPEEEQEVVTEEEIRMMVDAGSEKGTIDNEEKDMIQNVFEFDDLTIDEICVHRTDVDLLWVEDSIEEWEQLIHESRHSYYPVCGETVDDIIGVLDAKDYFRLRTKDRDHVMKEAIKQPYFVPENIKAATLFQNMKKTGNYFAVVLDEYGGMDGIITVRNLIEQLVGDLNDEAEIGQPSEIELISTDTWKIMGSASLDDVAEELKIKLPVDEYETFGGYIFGELGAVPDDGSQFELETDDLWIKVMRVKEHRVENTVVKKLPPKEKGEQEERKERE